MALPLRPFAFQIRWQQRGWYLALGATVLLVLLAVSPPFWSSPIREAVMAFFAPVCHQIPSRSPHLGGVAIAVCHRCLGIYLGLPLAAGLFFVLARLDPLLRKHTAALLVLALLPMLIDWSGDVLGFWHNTPWSRMLTGGLFGTVAGYYLARGLVMAWAPQPDPSKAHSLSPPTTPSSHAQ